MKLTKWLIYTVIIGAIPFIVRFFVFIATTNIDSNYIVNIVDMVTFGLVLHVSNINELESWQGMEDSKRTLFRGISLVLIVLLSALLGLAYIADLDKTGVYEIDSIKYLSVTLSTISFIFVLSIYIGYRITE
ncbi:hypothetical protein [Arsenicibacter rosenii]|uniref:Uncharacterized protein n=1 Tax=Arsenicibacter rosenii TaxID=1750698 RepID=A0A1S2VBS4_9BACT|nr:hypothetical protein [Arsenicibacter rosenii]OIN56191.1 hypothetical protein BLX24_26320 [Arsenicibacter rosenii]